MNEVTSLFRQAVSFASPTGGELMFESETTLTVNSKWSQKDIERKEKSTLLRSHLLDVNSSNVLSQSGPQEVNNEVWNKKSPSGNLRAVVRSGKDKKNEDKQYLEIYDKKRKLKTVDVLALEKHGKIISDDGQFGCFEWSSSEKQILYMAEKKKPKTASFFDTKSQKGDGDEEDKGDQVKRGCENEYYENWGEQLTERHHPVICVMEWETADVSVVESVDSSLSPGQAMWTPHDAGVVFCAWDHEPYRLGLKHCCQRKGGLFYLDLQTGSVDRLSPEDRAVRFPRFSPDMSRLVYFDTPVGGAHHQCSRLLMMDWATRKSKVVVDIVKYAPASSFQGIFIAALPRKIWFGDSVHLALSSAWRSVTRPVIINTDTGAVGLLCKVENHNSMSVLCVEKSSVLLTSSSISTPTHLAIATLRDLSKPESSQWIYPDGTPDTLDWISSWKILQHTPTSDRVSAINANLDYHSILCLPPKDKDGSLPPLIVFSHGGPHVAFDTSCNDIPNFFCLCGFAVLMVNYRGSWGFGQDNVDCLHGVVGEQDVKDVQSALTCVLDMGVVDSDKLMVFGGSHGGFLTTHLIGQYPKTFKAACTRNPVTNLISMWSTTDIKDWIFVEGGFPFDMASLVDDKMFSQLWKRSPMSYVHQVTTPVMLLVGLEDKRVPPSQAMEYYRALKAKNTPVRCLTYPSSNHSLSEVDVEGDCMVNTVMWFNTYI